MIQETETNELPPLTEKEAIFVRELTTHWNAARAAREAGATIERARHVGSEWKTKPHIKAHIDAHVKKRAEENRIDAENLKERLIAIIRADPRELIDHVRINCRHCWGIDGKYQHTPAEQAARRKSFDAGVKSGKIAAGQHFDEQGGVGYNRTRDPNPECLECHGEGEEIIVPKDTRDLSPDALALYAGVKRTKEGLQVMMHDKERAMEMLGRHFGMFLDRKALENPDGTAITMAPIMFVPATGGEGE